VKGNSWIFCLVLRAHVCYEFSLISRFDLKDLQDFEDDKIMV